MSKNNKLLALILAFCVVAGALVITAAANGLSEKEIINSAQLTPIRTGYKPLDKAVNEIFARLFTNSMTPYDKVLALYDYMINNYAGGSGSFTGAEAPSAPDVAADYSLGSLPDYISSLDSRIAVNALKIIETHQGTCLHYTAASIVFFRALGFETYEMHGYTSMAGGGMGEHYWPVIVINGRHYIFDAQVDDHIAKGGTIRYWRFCKDASEMAGDYEVSGIEGQMENFNSFATTYLPFVKIKSLSVTPDTGIKVLDEVKLQVSVQNDDNIDILYSFYVSKGTLGGGTWIMEWESLRDSIKEPSALWVPDESGDYTLKAVVRDKVTGAVMDTKTLSIRVGKGEQGKVLRASASAVYLSDLVTLTLNVSSLTLAKTEDLSYTYSYTRDDSNKETDIKEKTDKEQISFTPPDTGKYSVSAYIFNPFGEIASASVEIDVVDPSCAGDVNQDGKVTSADARLILRASALMIELDSRQTLLADVNEDGKITSADARIILRMSAGIEE